jgi:hypothetical protein
MSDKYNMTENKEKEQEKAIPTPDEKGGFIFSSVLKVFDPNTNEILVQKRGDD